MATAQDIINTALTFLQQTTQTGENVIAGLPAGTGESVPYTVSSLDQLLTWATDGQNRVCRLCVPIFDTVNVQPSSAGNPTLGPYSTLVSPSGRVLHRPSSVSIGARSLQPAGVGYLNSPANIYPMVPFAGDPTGWADSNTVIMLSNYISQPTFTIQGYFLPAPLTSVSTPIDPALDDFTIRAVAYYLAWQVAAPKNLDNSVIANRAAPCQSEFVASVKEIYTRVIENDTTLAAYFGPQPIDAMVQIMLGLKPKV